MGNVLVEQPDGELVKVSSNFVLLESRLGNQRLFGGHFEYQLRRADDTWRIASKKVCLINNDGIFNNLTFLF